MPGTSWNQFGAARDDVAIQDFVEHGNPGNFPAVFGRLLRLKIPFYSFRLLDMGEFNP